MTVIEQFKALSKKDQACILSFISNVRVEKVPLLDAIQEVPKDLRRLTIDMLHTQLTEGS